MSRHVLAIDHNAFSCCGSSSVKNFFNQHSYSGVALTDKNRMDDLLDIERDINGVNRKNLAIAILVETQEKSWGPLMLQRGWTKLGDGTKNSKTNNKLQIWTLDFTSRVIETPKPPPPANGFNAEGARLDRRDEPRSFDVGPRSTRSERSETNVKDYFTDVNGHRVLFVDLPVFNRGTLRDWELNFYSIRLAPSGESYSWLQGGQHRFPQPRVAAPVPLGVQQDEDEDDDF